jgi:hypothetical protein
MKLRLLRLLVICVVGSGVLFATLPFLIQAVGFLPWSRINCREEYVDIYSGRMRVQRWYWYRLVSETTTETPLSRLAPAIEKVQFAPVNTFSFRLDYSPHFGYHAAYYQIMLINRHWEATATPVETRRVQVQAVLKAWQNGSGDSLAYDYLESIGARAY